MKAPIFLSASLSSRRFDLRISAVDPNHCIRLFIFRPTIPSSPSDVPKWLEEEFLSEASDPLAQLKLCSAIFQSRTNILDITEIKSPENYLQPVDESIRQSSTIFLAAQTIDIEREQVSEVSR